jgi:hypothetical protein
MKRIAIIFGLALALMSPAAAQPGTGFDPNMKWIAVSPQAPNVFYTVSATDKKENTVSVMVAVMRRAGNPGQPNGSGSMRTEIIFCAKDGYEDTHQDVQGNFHPAAASYQALDFKNPGAMELISRAVCPKA